MPRFRNPPTYPAGPTQRWDQSNYQCRESIVQHVIRALDTIFSKPETIPPIYEELPEWMVVEWHKITLCPAVPAILRVSIFKSKRLKEGSLSFQNLEQKLKSVENSSQKTILSCQNIAIFGNSYYVQEIPNLKILCFSDNFNVLTTQNDFLRRIFNGFYFFLMILKA